MPTLTASTATSPARCAAACVVTTPSPPAVANGRVCYGVSDADEARLQQLYIPPLAVLEWRNRNRRRKTPRPQPLPARKLKTYWQLKDMQRLGAAKAIEVGAVSIRVAHQHLSMIRRGRHWIMYPTLAVARKHKPIAEKLYNMNAGYVDEHYPEESERLQREIYQRAADLRDTWTPHHLEKARQYQVPPIVLLPSDSIQIPMKEDFD